MTRHQESILFWLTMAVLLSGAVVALVMMYRTWRRDKLNAKMGMHRLPVLALAFLLAAPACLGPMDKARQDFAAALKVAQAAQARLKTYDTKHQLDLVRVAKDKQAAKAALVIYRGKRQAVMDQAARTEAVMDAAADTLLLGDGASGARAAADARASAQALRESVAGLMAEVH